MKLKKVKPNEQIYILFVGGCKSKMNLVKIKQILVDEMYGKVQWSGEKSGKYYHGERVAKIALTLKKHILPNNDSHDDIITVAGWFHDVMNGAEEHALAGAEKTKILLSDHCSEWEMNEIYDIIYRHDDRYSDRASFSDYAKIQQDADHLDHFGTYQIWGNILWGAHNDNTVAEANEEIQKWAEKSVTERVENELNFDISKKIYRERIEFYCLFAERFSVEI